MSLQELTEQQIKIELIKRTPYHMRKIDINEEDKVVYTDIGNIACWRHDEVSASLSLKLPITFTAEYTYLRVTEPNGVITNWFVLSKFFQAPNVWTLTLKHDVVRKNWNKIKEATCMIERGYVNSSNPLYYKSEGTSGNLTLGKRSKLLDSNLILAYVKTFELSNNNGAKIPEGTWKVQAGIPGYNNAPIVSEAIPNSIKIYDAPNNVRSGYLRMLLYWGHSIYNRSRNLDSNGNVGDERWVWNFFSDNGNACGTSPTGKTPTSSALAKIKASVDGFAQYVSAKQGLGLQDMPAWMKRTGGFGNSLKNTYPSNYECVINKGTAEAPQFYKLVFTNSVRSVNYEVKSYENLNEFISYTGQSWQIKSSDYSQAAFDSVVVTGNISYHEYKIEQYFLSNTPPKEKEACHTEFPALAAQTTAGAYSYNIFAFKVYDDGKGFEEDYAAQANSGQMIVSALMGTGAGVAKDKDDSGKPLTIPSLAGQVIDIQMCPFNESSIRNKIEKHYDIFAGASSTTKVGEYYLLNSQDIEQFVDYDLSDWKSKGNSKSRVNLSQMRLVCPNNSSMAMLNPDILSNNNTLRVRLNGTLYPYKPVYKVTPVATNSIIYANQDARDNMLVLGGDFSATQVSSGWSDYLIGNKNVEEAQQASIANQTMNQQMQYEFQKKSIQSQTNMSMTSAMLQLLGGLGGIAFNNPFSSISGLVNAGMGMISAGTNAKLQKENLEISNTIFANNIALNQKLFNLEMGNIQAMPNTIHKITNGSFDNDYSVMIEEYYSTQTEYEQFDKAIKKTGMNLNCIGKLIDYVNSEYFIFAQIIDCDSPSSSEANEINKEFQNGLKIAI